MTPLLLAALLSCQVPGPTRSPEVMDDPAAHGVGRTPALPPIRRGTRATVIAFTASDCPISKVYRPRLERLAARYRDRGVAFVLVHGNYDDPPPKGAGALHDKDGRLAAALGAERTTDLFLLDAKGVLRYRGALDDQYGLGTARPKPTRHYLVDALDAVLAGKTPAVPATRAPG